MSGEILGVGRRRFWHDDDKLEIVMSVGVDGASVTQVAQRHEIKRQQIYAWRHDLKRKGLWSPDAGALFFPVDLPVAQMPVAELMMPRLLPSAPRPSCQSEVAATASGLECQLSYV